MPPSDRVEQLPVPTRTRGELRSAADRLITGLGDNLHALVLYGSAVRGDFDARNSDVNLLIVLNHSTAEAHQVIRSVSGGRLRLDPMVLEAGVVDAAAQVFALKFMSIQRHHAVLYGEDPFAQLTVETDRLVFLVEQELRNERMRLIHAYVMSDPGNKRYARYVMQHAIKVLVDLSDLARAANATLPEGLHERVPVLATTMGLDAGVLKRLIDLRHDHERTVRAGADDLHRALLDLFDTAIGWLEGRWSKQGT